MENNESRIDRFYADMTDALMHETVEHIDLIGHNVPDPRTAPEAGFDGYAWPEIVAVLSEHATEERDALIAQEQIPYRWQ